MSTGTHPPGVLAGRPLVVRERAVAVRQPLRLRHLWVIPGLAIAVDANAIGNEHQLGLVPLLLFGESLGLGLFLERSREFESTDSSGYQRYIGPERTPDLGQATRGLCDSAD